MSLALQIATGALLVAVWFAVAMLCSLRTAFIFDVVMYFGLFVMSTARFAATPSAMTVLGMFMTAGWIAWRAAEYRRDKAKAAADTRKRYG